MKFSSFFTLLFLGFNLQNTHAQEVHQVATPLSSVHLEYSDLEDTLLVISNSIHVFYSKDGSCFLSYSSSDSPEHFNLNFNRHQVLKIETVDLNDDNFPELLIEHQSQSGHSSWYGGLSESSTQLEIIDVKHRLHLLSEYISYYVESWSNQLEKPLDSLSEGEEIIIIDSETDIYCYQLQYRIEENQIHFFPAKDPEGCEEYDEENVDNTFSLTLSESGFVRGD